MYLLFLFLCICAESAYSFDLFEHRLKIPNSLNVQDPCNSSLKVISIGHLNFEGNGPLNNFGSDFQKVREWPLLCSLDSDNDGFTNGQELGDPNCLWKVGNTPEFTNNITHPGVCTPVDSIRCKNNNICQIIFTNVCNFSTFSTTMLAVCTVFIALLTVFKLVSNREIKYKIETGYWPSVCCPKLPYDKPGFSWDV